MRTYVANIQSSAYQVFEFEKKVNVYDVKLNNSSSVNEFVLMIPKYDQLTFTLALKEEKTLEVTAKVRKKQHYH